MKPTNGKIIVSVNMAQKNEMKVGDIAVKTALLFEKNYREKSPVIACVENGNELVKSGDILLCHHNLFYQPSPYFLYDNLFSIPFSKILFAKIDSNGEINPICGNLIVERIPIDNDFLLPSEEKKTYKSMYKVVLGGWTKYKKDTIIFTRPDSGYDIVYNLNGVEKRVTKVSEDMICGILEK